MTALWFEPYRDAVVPLEGWDGRRTRSASGTGGERGADGEGTRDPRVRAAVVEVRGRQGTGGPGVVRHVDDPVLPAPQRAHRSAGGTRLRPDARQATAADAADAATGAHSQASRTPRVIAGGTAGRVGEAGNRCTDPTSRRRRRSHS